MAVLLEGFSDGLQGIRTWGDLAVLLAQSAVHWVLVILAYFWVLHALRGELWNMSFAAAALVLAFTLVGSAAQLPGVGGGAQVASFLVLTLVLGIDKEPAATGAIMVWLVTFASCSLVGLPLLLAEGWSMGELRQMAKAEEKAGEAALLEEAEHYREGIGKRGAFRWEGGMKCPFCAHLDDKVDRLAGGADGRSYSPAAGVPEVQPAVHNLRADR